MVLDDQGQEVAEHLLRNVEVRNDAVLHRTHCDDALRRTAQHALRFEPYTLDLFRLAIEGNDRWLVEYDPFALHVDQCICGAEINGNRVRREKCARFEEWPAH